MNTRKKNFKEFTKSLFLRYTITPILLLLVVFFVFTILIFKVKVVHDTNQSSSEIQSQVGSLYHIYSDEVNRMAESEAVINYLDTHRNSELVYEAFYGFNNKQRVKSIFHLIDKKGIIMATTALSENIPGNTNDDLLYNIVPLINKKPDQLLIDAHTNLSSHGKITVLIFGKAIKKDQQVLGYVIFQLYEEDLLELIYRQKSNIVVITDPFDHIIVTTNGIVKGLLNKFDPQFTSQSYVKIGDLKYYMSVAKRADLPFHVYALNAIPYNDHLILNLSIGFVVVMGGMLYVLVRVLAEKMSSRNVQSIQKLLTAVSRLQSGDLRSYVKIDTGDEFEIMADQYNVMLDHLNELLKKNKELSDIRRMNEIRFLQSQFNPHFVFNVLETLRYTMLMDSDKAQEIIITFSRLLRYSIANEEQDVILKKDLDYITDYLKLQKFRYNERLHYSIEISEEIINIRLPKLLLQPIIENAIKYGYQEKSNLTIAIKAKVDGDELILIVEDNGVGIDSENLEIIRNRLRQPQSLSNHIGLYNVHRCIVLFYGEGFGLTINSTIGKGTEIILKLPYVNGGESVV